MTTQYATCEAARTALAQRVYKEGLYNAAALKSLVFDGSWNKFNVLEYLCELSCTIAGNTQQSEGVRF